MREQLGDLFPLALGHRSPQIEGLGDGWTRHRQLPGQESSVERRFGPWGPVQCGTGLEMVGMCQESGQDRRDERGM